MKLLNDPDKMTLGEIEFFEEYTGRSIQEWGDGQPSAKMLTAVVYISGKRDNGAFTIDDARNVEISTLQDSEDDPPTQAAVAATSKSSRTSSKPSQA